MAAGAEMGIVTQPCVYGGLFLFSRILLYIYFWTFWEKPAAAGARAGELPRCGTGCFDLPCIATGGSFVYRSRINLCKCLSLLLLQVLLTPT